MATTEFTLSNVIKFNLSTSSALAGYAGMGSHAIYIFFLGLPTALLDTLLNESIRCCKTKPSKNTRKTKTLNNNQYALTAPNLVHKYITDESDYDSSLTVYRGGFFTKYPVGAIAETSGYIVNATVSATTFVATAAIGFALMAGCAAFMLGFLILFHLCRGFLGCIAPCSSTVRQLKNHYQV